MSQRRNHMGGLLVPKPCIGRYHLDPSSESYLGAQVVKAEEDWNLDYICLWSSVSTFPFSGLITCL